MVKFGAVITFVGDMVLKILESNGALRERFQECAVLRLPSQHATVGAIIICVYHIHHLSDFLGRQVGKLLGKLASNGSWEVKVAYGMIITCVPSGLVNCETQCSHLISNLAPEVFLVDMTVRGYMSLVVVIVGAKKRITCVGKMKPNIQESNGAVRVRFQECAVPRSLNQLKAGVGMIITSAYQSHRLLNFTGRQVG